MLLKNGEFVSADGDKTKKNNKNIKKKGNGDLKGIQNSIK
jgi:hypothetical protein